MGTAYILIRLIMSISAEKISEKGFLVKNFQHNLIRPKIKR